MAEIGLTQQRADKLIEMPKELEEKKIKRI
jgi:hypothetical protein